MAKEYKPINNLWKDSDGYRYFGTLKLSSKIKYDGDDFISLWEWVKQLKQQQEKFIKYLEEEIEFFRTFNLESANVCKDILVYYEKIIGGTYE